MRFSPPAQRPRISIDIKPEVRQRLRLAAARRDITVRQYVLEGIEERLSQDVVEDLDDVSLLTSSIDPVLAELWDNETDAAYDRL